jgi:hypothetical protein
MSATGQPEAKDAVKGSRHRGLRIRNSEHPPRQEDVGSPIWFCPSEADPSVEYVVNLDFGTCECPRYRNDKRKSPCKHIWACRLERSIATRVLPSTPNPYKNPPYYEAVKRHEEDCVRELLRCLAGRVPKRESAA